MKGKKLFSFIEVTEETPIAKLSILEQIRLLIVKLSNENREQLKAQDAETQEILRLQANLLEFFEKSTAPLREGKETKVAVQVSSKFLPVLDTVLQSNSIRTFYDVEVIKPDIEYDIDYFFKVILEVKAY